MIDTRNLSKITPNQGQALWTLMIEFVFFYDSRYTIHNTYNDTVTDWVSTHDIQICSWITFFFSILIDGPNPPPSFFSPSIIFLVKWQIDSSSSSLVIKSHFKTQSKVGKNWSRYDICEETRAQWTLTRAIRKRVTNQMAFHNHVTFCRNLEILSALDIGRRLPDCSQMAIRAKSSVRVHAALVSAKVLMLSLCFNHVATVLLGRSSVLHMIDG